MYVYLSRLSTDWRCLLCTTCMYVRISLTSLNRLKVPVMHYMHVCTYISHVSQQTEGALCKPHVLCWSCALRGCTTHACIHTYKGTRTWNMRTCMYTCTPSHTLPYRNFAYRGRWGSLNPWWEVYIYIYVYIHIYIYIYIYILPDRSFAYRGRWGSLNLWWEAPSLTVTVPWVLYMHAYIHTNIHTYTYICIRIGHIRTNEDDIHTHACIHTYIHTHTHASLSRFIGHSGITSLHESMHAYIHTYVYIQTNMHTCIQTYIYTYTCDCAGLSATAASPPFLGACSRALRPWICCKCRDHAPRNMTSMQS